MKRRNLELTSALERKNGVLSLEKSLSKTFKENLERARNEKADELMRAISLVKSHVEVGSERRNGTRVVPLDEPSLSTTSGTNFNAFFKKSSFSSLNSLEDLVDFGSATAPKNQTDDVCDAHLEGSDEGDESESEQSFRSETVDDQSQVSGDLDLDQETSGT